MKVFQRLALVTLLTISLICTATPPASATPASIASSTEQLSITPNQPSRDSNFDAAVLTLEKYVTITDTAVVLAAPDEVVANIDPSTYQQILAGVAEINGFISQGFIKTSDITPVGTHKLQDAGRNGFELAWWGWQLLLSHDNFDKLILASGSVAGIAGVLSGLSALGVITIPASIPIGAIAAIIGGATLIIKACNWNKRGVGIKHIWVGPPLVCWPQ